MKACVLRHQPDTEFYIGEQCFITELSNGDHDDGVSIARARVRPGVSTHWHALRGTVERYVLLEGAGVVEVGELPAETVGPGDVVIIPAGCRQRITNTGGVDLVFLAMCSPRFTPACYEDLEETV